MLFPRGGGWGWGEVREGHLLGLTDAFTWDRTVSLQRVLTLYRQNPFFNLDSKKSVHSNHKKSKLHILNRQGPILDEFDLF